MIHSALLVLALKFVSPPLIVFSHRSLPDGPAASGPASYATTCRQRAHRAQVAGSLADAPDTALGVCDLAPWPEKRMGEAGAAGPGPISA
jgi:hypothetical protein